MRRSLRLLVLGLVHLAGCALHPAYRDAGGKLAHFRPMETEPRVLYEPGAREFAERAREELPQAIARVEAAHHLQFAFDVRVYVCASDECFRSVVPEPPGLAAAVAYDNRLVLHPRLFNREPERLAPVLAHELSHLHLGQRIGHYSPALPVWFHEGLACHAAEGGGADLVSEADARQAAVAGRYFLPDGVHDPSQRRNANHWKLDMSVFYRQAEMLVEELMHRSETGFRALLLAIQNNVPFDAAFRMSFGEPAETLARQFFEGLRGAPAVDLAVRTPAPPP